MQRGSTLQGSGRLGAASPAPRELLQSSMHVGEHQPSASSPHPQRNKALPLNQRPISNPGIAKTPGQFAQGGSLSLGTKIRCLYPSWCFGTSSFQLASGTWQDRVVRTCHPDQTTSAEGFIPHSPRDHIFQGCSPPQTSVLGLQPVHNVCPNAFPPCKPMYV